MSAYSLLLYLQLIKIHFFNWKRWNGIEGGFKTELYLNFSVVYKRCRIVISYKTVFDFAQVGTDICKWGVRCRWRGMECWVIRDSPTLKPNLNVTTWQESVIQLIENFPYTNIFIQIISKYTRKYPCRWNSWAFYIYIILYV